MRTIRSTVIPALLLLLAAPLQAQVVGGSLVVWVVSERSDYVVIGAESRNLDSRRNFSNDRSCKVISLGGDTLFYETGSSVVGVRNGKSWSSKGAARAAYSFSQKRDVLSLTDEWGTIALRWFTSQPTQDLLTIAHMPDGNLVTGGFIGFDKERVLTTHGINISYDAGKRSLRSEPSSQAPGQIGAAGVALDLVKEFIHGKTDRAIKAFGPIGAVRWIAGDPLQDVSFVQKTIKFAMDNAVGADKSALGGDIDIAIIRKDRTIEWVARKSWCSGEDLKPTRPAKRE
jgi:hypothetical protein